MTTQKPRAEARATAPPRMESVGFQEARRRIEVAARHKDKDLDLSGLGLTEIPLELCVLTGLTSLNLWDNEIGDDGARALAALTGLTSLNLWDNEIGDDGARALAALTGLTSLNLWDNEIGDDGARALAALTGLTSLNLRGNQIGADGARALAALTGLTSLDLSSNQISDDGARALTALTGLTSLDLVEQRWIEGWSGEIRVKTQRGQAEMLLNRVLELIDKQHDALGARPSAR